MLPVLLGIIAVRVIAGGIKNLIRSAEESGTDLRDSISGHDRGHVPSSQRQQPSPRQTTERDVF